MQISYPNGYSPTHVTNFDSYSTVEAPARGRWVGTSPGVGHDSSSAARGRAGAHFGPGGEAAVHGVAIGGRAGTVGI